MNSEGVSKIKITIAKSEPASDQEKLELIGELEDAVKQFLDEAKSSDDFKLVTTDCAGDGNREVSIEREYPKQAQ